MENHAVNEVTIVDVRMPFMSMVVFHGQGDDRGNSCDYYSCDHWSDNRIDFCRRCGSLTR